MALDQTDQISDATDEQYDILGDVFLNVGDLHRRYRRRNFYGPVLFEFNVALLLEPSLPEIWITRSNAVDWPKEGRADGHYFQSVAELVQLWRPNEAGMMLTLRHAGVVPFEPHLRAITINNPRFQTASGLDFFSAAVGAIAGAAKAGGLHASNVKFERRQCESGCKCVAQYTDMKSTTRRKFFAPW